MKRRSLLQGTGFLLGAWGLKGIAIPRQAQVMAAPNPRKLALLIGINQYRNASLNGCLTDIELQRELLIHRFGFQPSDVLTLSDQQATRSQIETAFAEHLIKQVKSPDIVVVHFSGCGSSVKLGTTADDVQPCLITADEPTSGDLISNALPLDTLLLLLKSLATNQVTTVLDTGFFYPGYSLQGNVRVRALPSDSVSQLIPEELQFQEQFLQQLRMDSNQAKVQRRSGRIPGVVLAAANAQQFATEAPWTGFHAGLFTYALTQQLWQATPETTLRISLSRTAELIGKRVDQKQQPELTGQTSRDRLLKPYHAPLLQPPAEGVIRGFDPTSKIAQLWLGGLPPQVLEQYGSNSLFTVEASPGLQPLPLLQLTERNGLTAKAKVVTTSATEAHSQLQTGQRIQEAIRVLPRSLGLSIAIDAHLDRIERVDAISAFSAIPHISAVVAGEQVADYVFGKTQEVTQIATASPEGIEIPSSKYGLFSQGREALTQTIGDAGEAVKVAVKRLSPQLQTLLATKLLGLTVNEGSSQLGVRASLLNNPDQLLIQQQTDRVALSPSVATPSDGKLLSIAIGSRLLYQLENNSDQAIHVLVVGLDNAGSPFALAPNQPQVIEARATMTLPIATPTMEWVVREPAGLAETYIICSRSPFQQTQALLTTSSNLSNRPFLSVTRFLEVAQAILQDLHQASEQAAQWVGGSPDLFALDVNDWATFRFVYQVV